MRKSLAVLIVEDLESDAQLSLRTLQKAGYEIHAERVEDAAQMRAALAKQPWDLVVSDYSLPQFDARTALVLLQQTDLDIPFIVVSGTIGEETAVDMLKAGAHDYLMKNNLARLGPAVERELGQAETRRAQRRAEMALRESEERLNRAVSAGKVGLWDWDLRTNHVFFSPEWKRQIGYEEHELPGEYGEWEQRLHPDDRDLTLRAVKEHMTHPETHYMQEFRLRHKDGTYRWILARGTAVVNEKGQAIRMVGTHVDITDRRRLEDQFYQAQKMESVGRLAGGIAHDFNNLLTIILGYTDFALETLPEGDPLRDGIQPIQDAADRATALTAQLLALSRKQTLQPKVLNLCQTVVDEEKMLRRLIGEDIEIVLQAAKDLGHVKIDPGQIGQVILNLAVNARDAMPGGGKLTLELSNVELDNSFAAAHLAVRPGPHVLLAVSDTGVGMDSDTLGKIFDPFFTTKELGKGTGLGLATVYGIVHQSGGHIFVYSEPNKGTTFKIYLPRVDEEPQNTRVSRPAAPARGSETILLAEDEAMVREIALRILTRAGYTVLAAATGKEALMLLKQHRGSVGLLLTDVVMPGMSGRELANQAAEMCPGLKILFMSGYTGNAIVHQGILDEGTHFVNKPFTATELTQRVRDLLDSRTD